VSIIQERIVFNKTESGDYKIEIVSLKELEDNLNNANGKDFKI